MLYKNLNLTFNFGNIFSFSNNIDELSQVEFLALCSSLTHLTLEGNPLCTTPSPDEASVSHIDIMIEDDLFMVVESASKGQIVNILEPDT